MAITLDRLGNGAAFLLNDEVTGTTILLGCGEVRTFGLEGSVAGHPKVASAHDVESGNESSASDGTGASVSAVSRQYTRELKELLKRDGDHALDAILITDYRPETCFMLPFLTEKCAGSGQNAPPDVFLSHATRALAPHMLVEYWYVCTFQWHSVGQDHTGL